MLIKKEMARVIIKEGKVFNLEFILPLEIDFRFLCTIIQEKVN